MQCMSPYPRLLELSVHSVDNLDEITSEKLDVDGTAGIAPLLLHRLLSFLPPFFAKSSVVWMMPIVWGVHRAPK